VVQVQPGHENHVEVSGIKISADPAIRSYSLEHRSHALPRPDPPPSCVVEFAMRVASRAVRCVPWYMPQVALSPSPPNRQNGSSSICGPWDTARFQKMMGRAFSANHSESDCLPDCNSMKYTYALSMAGFRRCDLRNLNYSPLCSLSPKFSPAPWQAAVEEVYRDAVPSYVSRLDSVYREYYPTRQARDREMIDSYTRPKHYSQTYNAYQQDIGQLYVYFGQPTTTEYTRVVSLSWVGFLAQAGGLIGACLGFSFISGVELLYWFLIRFCRLSRTRRRQEREEETKAERADPLPTVSRDLGRSFERLWCEGWESPCVDTEREGGEVLE
jgi:hypothetical protein